MLFALTLLVGGMLPQPDPAPAESLRRLGRQIVDAGYRSDVPAIESALTGLRPLVNTPATAARAAYFAGFGSWQLALIQGAADPRLRDTHLDAAVRDLQTAVNLDGADVEATLLLGHCYGLKRSADPRGDLVVQLLANALRARALAQAPSNPRVALIEAMGLYYRPPQAGGNRERGLARWNEALELFAKAGDTADVGWGHAEAYLWLSAVYLNAGDRERARAVLEKSVALRPDFVAARRALEALR